MGFGEARKPREDDHGGHIGSGFRVKGTTLIEIALGWHDTFWRVPSSILLLGHFSGKNGRSLNYGVGVRMCVIVCIHMQT